MASDARVEPAELRSARRVDAEGADDWRWCREILGQVSRSFALPISLVPPDVEVALTVGYLLCRVADTVEDRFSLEPEARARLLDAFVNVLDGQLQPEAFHELLCNAIAPESLPARDVKDPELALVASLDRVMRVLRTEDPAVQRATDRWVREMCSGMRDYTLRGAGPDGLVAVTDLQDLERYCYYVAGTVGHLVTDVFLVHMRGDAAAPPDAELRRYAESFGIGLQLVNILKDVASDLARGRSFVPRDVCARVGLAPRELTLASQRAAAHACLEPLFESSRRHLEAALIYTLTIPPHRPQLRLFCLVPLWMAARTLTRAHHDDQLLVEGSGVKISRAEVLEIVRECRELVGQDDELSRRFATLGTSVEE